MLKKNYKDVRPCVIGLGYVGLPLFLNLARKYKTLGYDISKERILDLKIFSSSIIFFTSRITISIFTGGTDNATKCITI